MAKQPQKSTADIQAEGEPEELEREENRSIVWESYIQLARKGDNKLGRLLIGFCIDLLEGSEVTYSPSPKKTGYVPEPLASYLAEMLRAALDAPAKEVSRAMHITRSSNRPKSGASKQYSKQHKWCIAQLKKQIEKVGPNNLPGDEKLAGDIATAFFNEQRQSISTDTIEKWLIDERKLIIAFACFEKSEMEIPSYIRNHPLYKIA